MCVYTTKSPLWDTRRQLLGHKAETTVEQRVFPLLSYLCKSGHKVRPVTFCPSIPRTWQCLWITWCSSKSHSREKNWIEWKIKIASTERIDWRSFPISLYYWDYNLHDQQTLFLSLPFSALLCINRINISEEWFLETSDQATLLKASQILNSVVRIPQQWFRLVNKTSNRSNLPLICIS